MSSNERRSILEQGCQDDSVADVNSNSNSLSRRQHPDRLMTCAAPDTGGSRVTTSQNTFTVLPQNQNDVSRPDSSSSSPITNDNDGTTSRRHLSFSRMAYNLPAFNTEFDMIKVQKRRRIEPCGAGTQALEKVKDNCCSSQSLARKARSLFPIVDWSWNYNLRENLIADLIAGITIVVFHVPQSMGYSLISQVPPVYGLYSAFFPALVYAVMGTSRQCAVGLFAVISLMTGSLVSQTRDELGIQAGHPQFDSINVQIAVAVSFLIGIYQLLFGILQMGFVSVYLSEQLVSGFTTAASLYVFTSQLPFLFGCHLPHRSGPLALINSYLDLANHIHETNGTAIGISALCCLILIIFKFYVNPMVQRRTGVNVPIPIELALVVTGTILSHFLDLSVTQKIDIVGKIPTGLPVPADPDWAMVGRLAKRSIPMAIVAYSLTISVGKIFAAKHNYSIDPNQELLALGVTNIVGSFFSCLPSAASLSRSAVQESAGGKTQLVSIVNCIGILFALYFAGPLLEKLPQCILAAIIAVALKGLFWQVKDFFRYWKVSPLDGSIWLVTFLAVFFLDVDLGLYVGLGYSLITLIYKSQRPKTYMLGSINGSDVYVPLKKYASARELEGIRIYQFCGPLHFANVEYFKMDLIRRTGVSVNDIVAQRAKTRKRLAKKVARAVEDCELQFKPDKLADYLPSHIIIDCSMFSYIDTTGVSQLKSTVLEYESIGIKTYLAGVAVHVDKMLHKDNFYKEVPPHHVYITIHDAVHHAIEDIEEAYGLDDCKSLAGDSKSSQLNITASDTESCACVNLTRTSAPADISCDCTKRKSTTQPKASDG
ncbi:Prestin [Halotydeus destructor]|nr:Prestin [Halotydeus destructor]